MYESEVFSSFQMTESEAVFETLEGKVRTYLSNSGDSSQNFLLFYQHIQSKGAMSSTDAQDIQSSAKSSTSTVLSALILNGSIFGAEMVLFLILRPQFKKIYASKTFLGPSDERTPSLSKGILSWIPEFFKISDTEILKRQGLDAYVLMELLAMFVSMDRICFSFFQSMLSCIQI